jgi:hypothetical protein
LTLFARPGLWIGVTLQHIEAYAAEPVDVWVVDLGEKADFRWSHGIVVGEEEFELEGAAWKYGGSR